MTSERLQCLKCGENFFESPDGTYSSCACPDGGYSERLIRDRPIEEERERRHLRDRLRHLGEFWETVALLDDKSTGLRSSRRNERAAVRKQHGVGGKPRNVTEDLKGLAQLFDDGLLTKKQFAAAKKRLLEP